MLSFGAVIAIFFVLLLARIPIGFVLLLSSAIYIFFSAAAGTVPIEVIPQRMIGSTASFVFTAIPAFILIGEVMNVSGMSTRLVDLAKALVGHTKGGVGMVSLVSSAGVSLFSGSPVANAAGTGAVTIPAMIRSGYSRAQASAIEASSSSLGAVIPPSIAMVVWGGMTGVSIGGLFMAGFVPAAIFILGFIFVLRWQAARSGVPRSPRATLREVSGALLRALPSIVVPISIIGTILAGLATPTEAASIGAVVTVVLACGFYGSNWRDVVEMLVRAGKTTASVMFVIACSSVFAWMLTREQAPTRIAEGLLSGVGDGALLLLLMILLFVLLGLFMESLAAMALTAGVVMAVGTSAGIDPLHLSLIAVLALSLGVITPPVGVVLFVTSKIAKTSIERTSIAVLPYVLVYIIGMTLLALLPDVALFLPRLLLG